MEHCIQTNVLFFDWPISSGVASLYVVAG